jgi:hypothetical protein
MVIGGFKILETKQKEKVRQIVHNYSSVIINFRFKITSNSAEMKYRLPRKAKKSLPWTPYFACRNRELQAKPIMFCNTSTI